MTMALSTERRRPSLSEYISYRLGSDPRAQFRNWLTRSWGANSFADFWRYFNPVYGYVLYYYAYRPLQRVVPRLLAMWLTFVACGFVLHDLVGWALGRKVHVPEMTLLFAVLGLLAVVGRVLKMDISPWPLPLRIGTNLAYLAGSFAIVLLLVR